MTDLPRIVLLANNIDEVGGAQRVVHVLAQGLATRGHDVTLVGVVPHPPVHVFESEPKYRQERLLSRRVPALRPGGRARQLLDPRVRRNVRERALLEGRAVAALQAILDSGPPGIVITAQLWAMEHLAQCDLGSRSRPQAWRVIGQYHSSFEAAARGRDLARAMRVYRDIDSFLSLTQEDARLFAAAGFANTGWIENPLAFWPEDPAKLPEEPAARTAELHMAQATSPVALPSVGTVTYLGRFSPEKGPEILLRAWRLAVERRPESFAGWRLQLVGSGPDDARVRSAADGIASVSILGTTSDPAAVLQSSDVLVLPSLVEGFPLVLAEALACGLACVASDCSPGVRALIKDGETGILAERGNPSDLADRITDLVESVRARARIGAAGRQSVRRLKLDQILDQWQGLFTTVQR